MEKESGTYDDTKHTLQRSSESSQYHAGMVWWAKRKTKKGRGREVAHVASAPTMKISLRPLRSGRPTYTWRSNRPGRRMALSKMSARLVPANTTTLSAAVKPSISTSSWFSVF
jgi:hypothetical protein